MVEDDISVKAEDSGIGQVPSSLLKWRTSPEEVACEVGEVSWQVPEVCRRFKREEKIVSVQQQCHAHHVGSMRWASFAYLVLFHVIELSST